MFRSPNRINSSVGADPYFRFARPFYGPCQMELEPGETISPMMFSLDGGGQFAIPTPVVEEPREDHTYQYEVKGQGYPLQVRLDDQPLEDNYGQILVIIEAIK
jgi:hypothetical protein